MSNAPINTGHSPAVDVKIYRSPSSSHSQNPAGGPLPSTPFPAGNPPVTSPTPKS
jgi:hypothetical protein